MSKARASKVMVTRSWVAVAAHQRNSAGAMGGSIKARNKRARKAARQALRSVGE